MPEYNPFWEEKDYEGQPDWWKWYHLGYDDGYSHGTDFGERTEEKFQKLNQQVEAMEALIAANFRINKDLVLDDTQNKTPDGQA